MRDPNSNLTRSEAQAVEREWSADCKERRAYPRSKDRTISDEAATINLRVSRDTLRSSLSAVTRERDECAATARARLSEWAAAESKWSAAARERNDAVALLRRMVAASENAGRSLVCVESTQQSKDSDQYSLLGETFDARAFLAALDAKAGA